MRTRPFLVRTTLVASMAAFCSAFAITGPASADTDKDAPLSDQVHAEGATAEVLALMRDQIPLDRAADRIESATKSTSASGLGGFIVDAAAKTLNVYWKGAVPATVRAEESAAVGSGIKISVHPAAFTLRQLEAERDRLATLHITGKASGPRVVAIGPKADGSGLEVGVAGTPAGSGKAVQQALTGITSKVSISAVASEGPVATSRYGDTSPYWGGSYMERQVDATHFASCTTGFPLKTSYSGQPKVMLTAAHCGQGFWYNGTGFGINSLMGGTFPDEDRTHDAMIVAMPTAGRQYDGGSIAGEAAQFSKPIRGQFGNRTGDSICTSGSFSGANCGITVAATGQTITMGGFGTVKNMVRAEKNDRTASVGNGDSGGPAFSLTSDATGVYARGTISAISGNQADWRTCRGVPGGANSDPNARHCSWKFWYPDVLVQLQGLNAAVGDRTFRVLLDGE